MPLRQKKTVPHDGTQTVSTMFTNPVKRLLRSGNPRNRQQVRDAQRNPKGPARNPRGAGARPQIRGWMPKKVRTKRALALAQARRGA